MFNLPSEADDAGFLVRKKFKFWRQRGWLVLLAGYVFLFILPNYMWLLRMLLQYLILVKLLIITIACLKTLQKYCNISKVFGYLF